MHPTSFTRQDTHRRCPRRYYYRYLAQDEVGDHLLSQNLYGLRELAGLLIHRTMAQMVNELAAGTSVSLTEHIQSCSKTFEGVIDSSSSISPGTFVDGLQIAEFFNGVPATELSEDIDYWREAIPLMLEHGYRASMTLELGRRNEKREIRTEVKEIWHRTKSKTHMVFDVLTSSSARTVVIDWKTHGMENSDFRQIRMYLAYLHHVQGIPVSRLFGFGVDLLREKIERVPFNPYGDVATRPRTRSFTRPETQSEFEITEPRDSYAPQPDPKLCRACPFATVCNAATL